MSNDTVISRLEQIVKNIEQQIMYLTQQIQMDNSTLKRLERELEALKVDKEAYTKAIKDLRAR